MHHIRIAAAAIVLLSFGPAYQLPARADQVTWFGNRSEDGASLIYGTPDSGYGKIVFTCEAGQDDLMFVYEHEPINPQDGVEVDVLLSAGDIEVPVSTTGTRLEIDDAFILEGQTRLDKRLRDILTSSGTLTVTVEDGTAEYPLDGAAKAAGALLEVCSPES